MFLVDRETSILNLEPCEQKTAGGLTSRLISIAASTSQRKQCVAVSLAALCGYNRDQSETGSWRSRIGDSAAHASSFHMAFCDGSMHSIGYDIDPVAHRALTHRFKGEVAQVDGL